MCGIAGASFDPGFQIDAGVNDIAAHMLLDIEHRGTHATGLAWYRPDGKVRFRKDPIRARKFVKSILPNLDVGPTFIAHTRFATQGSPKNIPSRNSRRNYNEFLVENGIGAEPEAISRSDPKVGESFIACFCVDAVWRTRALVARRFGRDYSRSTRSL